MKMVVCTTDGIQSFPMEMQHPFQNKSEKPTWNTVITETTDVNLWESKQPNSDFFWLKKQLQKHKLAHFYESHRHCVKNTRHGSHEMLSHVP